MVGNLLQILTASIGGLAIFLRSIEGHKKLAYVLGILSCPCWILTEIYYKQYILLPINALYLYGWISAYLQYRRDNEKRRHGLHYTRS